MSLAKVNQVKRVIKPGTCGSCGVEIKKGDPAVRFKVGFRGITQTRCTKSECYPKPSERESSLVASIYAAQEAFDPSDFTEGSDFSQAVEDIQSEIDDVIQQYEDNPMYDNSDDMQERVSTLEQARDALEDWDSDLSGEEPTADDRESWEGFRSFAEAHDKWLDDAREALIGAVNEMELP